MKNSKVRVAARRGVALSNLKLVEKPNSRQKREIAVLEKRIKGEDSYYVGRSIKKTSTGEEVEVKPKRRIALITKTKGRVKHSRKKGQTNKQAKHGRSRKKWVVTGEQVIITNKPVHEIRAEHNRGNRKGTQVVVRILRNENDWS